MYLNKISSKKKKKNYTSMFICCQAVEKSCIGISDFLVKSCGFLCPTDKPSPLYTIFSFLINIAMIIVAGIFLGNDAGVSCNQSSCRGWYIAFFPLCIVNMIFAVYIYYKFMSNLRKGNRACKTMSKLLLYDIGVYLYLFVNPVFVVVWLAVGHTMCGEEIVCEHLRNYQVLEVLLGVFFGAGIFMFFLSVAVQCCYEEGGGDSSGQTSSSSYQQFSPHQSSSSRNRRTDSDFRTSIVHSMFSSNNDERRNNTTSNNRNNNNNNNNNNTESTMRVVGAVASVAAGVAGKGLTRIGNWMQQSNNNNSSNNNPRESHQHQQEELLQQPLYHQQQQQQPTTTTTTIYDTTPTQNNNTTSHNNNYDSSSYPVAEVVTINNQSSVNNSYQNNNNNQGLAPPPPPPPSNQQPTAYQQPQW